MISSDLHGAEEPIRWTLGWQRQDRAYQEPMYIEEEEPLIRTSFGMDHGLWGSAPDGQDVTIHAGRFPGHVAALIC